MLLHYATFCAFAERFGTGWHGWPEEPAPPGLAGRAAGAAGASRRKIASASTSGSSTTSIVSWRARRRSLPVMQDLPIGFDAGGADGWAFQDVAGPRHQRRRAARRVQHARAGLGPAAVRPRQAARGRLRTVRPDDPRVPAARGRPADRPRDGPLPAVLDPCRHGARPGRVRPIARRRAPGHRGARESARAGDHRRRGSRHRGGVDARGARGTPHPVVPAGVVREGAAVNAIPNSRCARSRRTICRRWLASGREPISRISGS